MHASFNRFILVAIMRVVHNSASTACIL